MPSLPGAVQLRCSPGLQSVKQHSLEACEGPAVSGDQLCHFLPIHVVEVPVRLLHMSAGLCRTSAESQAWWETAEMLQGS